jgi:hypothetical protein
LDAERAVLVRISASQRGISLARSLGVHLLNGATLAAREKAHAWLPERFAHVDGDECRAAETRADTQLRAFGELPSSLLRFLRHDALLSPSHEILGALVALRNAVTTCGVLPDPLGVVLASHALVGLVLATLIDAARSETLPNDELKRRLHRALTAGSPNDEHVLDVLGQADELFRHFAEHMHAYYVQAGAERLTIALPSARDLVAERPAWLDRYVDVVERLRANPHVARDLLQTIELACFDGLMGGVACRARSFDRLFTAEHRNLVLVSVALLEEIIGEDLTNRVGPLSELPFDRVPAAVPDRRQPESATQESLLDRPTRAKVAKELEDS